MNFQQLAKLALALAAFLREDVAQMGLTTFVVPRCITFEALGSAPIGLDFRHFKLPFDK